MRYRFYDSIEILLSPLVYRFSASMWLCLKEVCSIWSIDSYPKGSIFGSVGPNL